MALTLNQGETANKMGNPQIRVIFFDLGNVLLRLDMGKFVEKLTELTGLEARQLRAGFAGDLVPRYERGLLTTDGFLAQLCGKLGVFIGEDDFLDAWTCLFCDDLLISEDLLRELAQKHQLWAISNTNRMHFEFIRAHYRFLEHFRGWILSYEVGLAKPDPAIFIHALEKAGVSPPEALFIDDQLANVESARSVGIDAIHFSNFDQVLSELRSRGIVEAS